MSTKAAYDLIVRDVMVEPDYETVDIGVRSGEIVSLGPGLSGKTTEEIDGAGCLASPPFVDPHTHLDKAFLKPSPNRSGTLEEAIRIMDASKDRILAPDFEDRVERALRWAIENGTLAIRSHVDVGSGTKTESVHRMLAIKERWREYLDLQIVAFPQEGLIGDPDAPRYVREALEMGADVVGGIPALEGSDSDVNRHIDMAFEIAAEFGCDVDMHVDETDDPASRTLEAVADKTVETGWQGRVSAAHCCALAAYDDPYAREVIEKAAEARIHIIANAPVNLALQGRADGHPKRRGITRVKELLEAGVNVSCGHDNLQDVFFPFGRAEMLEVAFVTALAAHMTGEAEIQTAFDFPRLHAAKILDMERYGIERGAQADFILLPVKSATEALALKPPRAAVFRMGRLICKTESNTELMAPPPSNRG